MILLGSVLMYELKTTAPAAALQQFPVKRKGPKTGRGKGLLLSEPVFCDVKPILRYKTYQGGM